MRLTFQRYPSYVAMWEKLWSCFGHYFGYWILHWILYTNTINKICPCDQRENEAGSKSQSLWWIKTICDLHLVISNVIQNQKKLALVSGCQRWDKAGSYISATLPHFYLTLPHLYLCHHRHEPHFRCARITQHFFVCFLYLCAPVTQTLPLVALPFWCLSCFWDFFWKDGKNKGESLIAVEN